MNREVAIAVLKEVFDSCHYMDATAITLIPSTTEGTGYQIYINTNLYSDSRTCLAEIMARYGLKFRESEDRLVIYQPHVAKRLF